MAISIGRILFLAFCLVQTGGAAETFRVATFNVENYLAAPEGTRRGKESEAKAKVQESILALKPDVLALQEMGSTNILLELRAALKTAGLDLPFWEHITGFDTNIHLAILSRYPFVARHSHTNETYLLSGRRFRVSRGFAEVEVQVNPNYKFTLISVHLKSRVPSPLADEAEMREAEALLLRGVVESRLAAAPNANLVVLGDFNDLRDSKPLRALTGRGRFSLFDTRPVERNGCAPARPINGSESRPITWTFYYGKEDVYSRFDYILLSAGMKKEWIKEETYIPVIPNWGLGSDHRPIMATFEAVDR